MLQCRATVRVYCKLVHRCTRVKDAYTDLQEHWWQCHTAREAGFGQPCCRMFACGSPWCGVGPGWTMYWFICRLHRCRYRARWIHSIQFAMAAMYLAPHRAAFLYMYVPHLICHLLVLQAVPSVAMCTCAKTAGLPCTVRRQWILQVWLHSPYFCGRVPPCSASCLSEFLLGVRAEHGSLFTMDTRTAWYQASAVQLVTNGDHMTCGPAVSH
jgi:hypothetical protein